MKTATFHKDMNRKVHPDYRAVYARMENQRVELPTGEPEPNGSLVRFEGEWHYAYRSELSDVRDE